ncbi:MAG: hypothetical protein EOO09_10245 [Chitinophagaceae bacterium]|nr:MAG: hypothetical protein EOO09_10245 [Chitinophagaceae bacterium]
MKYLLLLVVAALSAITSFSQQQETMGVLTYTTPVGWKKELKQGSTVFSITNKKTRGWSQIAVYQQTASKGSIDADFASEWAEMVTPLGTHGEPQLSEVQEFDGWKILNGTGSFVFSGATSSASLTVISGYNTCLSVLVNSNTTDYAQVAYDFLANLQLAPPAADAGQVAPATDPAVIENNGRSQTPEAVTVAYKDNFTYNTTNFDDGWVSTVQADWVQVAKGNVKVLLHYAKEGTIFPSDPDPLIRAAWDILVSPRYSSLNNFRTTYITSYNRIYLGMGYATDNSSRQKVFLVLFRQGAGWQEVITPDKNTFISAFGFDPETVRWDSETALVKTLEQMSGRNRFSVAASDLEGTGEWNANFSANTYWTNTYTGASAGMSTYSSSQWFVFGSGKSYQWQLVAANSGGGTTKVAQARGEGSFRSVGNWQLHFSNMEGKAKTYDVYFSAVKNGRILYTNDAEYPGSGNFTGFARKK